MRKNARPALLATALFSVCFLVFAGAGRAGAQAATAPTSVIDGTVAVVSDTTLTLTIADGSSKSATVGADTLVLARELATLDSIKAGDALGIAARRGSDGSLIANSINIFSPEMYPRVRKGQFPMQSGDIMTNAVVRQAQVRVDGQTLTMELENRTSVIEVPAGTQIHRLATRKLDDVKAGMHIVVRGTAGPDGVVAATTVNFEIPVL